MRKIPVSEFENIKKLYECGMILSDIGKKYDVTRESIAKNLRKQGVVIQHGSSRKVSVGVNEQYFESDSEGSAYFYGLLLADGCISDLGKVNIALESSDSYILDSFKEELNLSSTVRHATNKAGSKFSQFCFTNKTISNSLTNLGMLPRKSTKEVAPEKFTENRHFWRGVVDGDGHVGKKTTRLYLCGSVTICTQFLEYCKSINPSINTQVARMKGDLFRTTISGIKAATILNELYSNCTFKLERKASLAENTLMRYPEVRHVF